MANLFANSGDPDRTAHSAASDLGLHCLPLTLSGVSRPKCVNWICGSGPSCSKLTYLLVNTSLKF